MGQAGHVDPREPPIENRGEEEEQHKEDRYGAYRNALCSPLHSIVALRVRDISLSPARALAGNRQFR